MRITKLEYQKKNPERVSVYVDGKFATGLNVNDIVKLGLYNGQEISQDYLNKIIAESDFGKAFNASLNFLSFRPRSEYEIRQYLKRKKVEDIDGVVEKLRQIGQINDEQFAAWWVEQRSTFRPKGKRALEMELARKGIKVKLPKDKESEGEKAMRAIQKKLKLWSQEKLGEQKWREKIMRFLISRGFDYDTVEEVLAKLGAAR
ncbi:RecX family transcriptional regulator [Patescibacteria group bacterium]|nr:RecX family transcriptional regulator [Patescibacteria group bacterium]